MTEREQQDIEYYIPGEPDKTLDDGECWVDTGWGADDHTHGVYRGDLYDNREDCKNQTHMGCSWWEQLRKIQQEG